VVDGVCVCEGVAELVTEGVGDEERLGVLVADGVGVVVGLCVGVPVRVPVLVVEMLAVSEAVVEGVAVGESEGDGEALAQMPESVAPVAALPLAAPYAQAVQLVELAAAHDAAPHCTQLVGVSAAAEPAALHEPSAPRASVNVGPAKPAAQPM
jgi:hypothetical protein